MESALFAATCIVIGLIVGQAARLWISYDRSRRWGYRGLRKYMEPPLMDDVVRFGPKGKGSGDLLWGEPLKRP
jgi:hypothetical protein